MENAQENLNIVLGQLLIEEDQHKYKVIEICPKNRFQKFNDELAFSPLKIVHRAYDAEYGKQVLWHTMKVRKIQSKQLLKICSELSLMKAINHVNVMNCIDFWVKTEEKQIIFVTEITDGGCLGHYLDKIKTIKLKVIKSWAEQILKGLEYLHQLEKPIVHQSIRCNNIYINSSTNQIKLGQIGLLFTTVDPFESCSNYLQWTAPEILTEKPSIFSDIYSFGMTLLEITTGKKPYSECKNMVELCDKISRNIKPKSLKQITCLQFRQIIESCIDQVPSKRPSAKDLLLNNFWKTVEQNDNSSIKISLQQKQEQFLNKRSKKQHKNKQKSIKLNDQVVKKQSQNEIKFIFQFSQKKYEIKLQRQDDECFQEFIDYLTKQFEQKSTSKQSHFNLNLNKFEDRQIIREDTHFLSSHNPTMKTMRFDYLYQSRVKQDQNKKSLINISQYNQQGQNDTLLKIQELFIGMYQMYRNKLQSWRLQDSIQQCRFFLQRKQLEQLQSLEKQKVMVKRKDKSNQVFLANSINFIDFLNNSQAPWPNEAYEIQKDIMNKNIFISSGKPEDVLSLNFSSIQNYRQQMRADFEQYMFDEQDSLSNAKLNESFIECKVETRSKVTIVYQTKQQFLKQQIQKSIIKTQQQQIKTLKPVFEKKQSIQLKINQKNKEKQKNQQQPCLNNI